MKSWFEEPQVEDNTYSAAGEGTPEWLARSTTEGAKYYRKFLNNNLSVLPFGCQDGIYAHLRQKDHHSDGFFELVVARTLQEMGADIECEPTNPIDGTRVDFAATFPEGTVYVEATSPKFDKDLQDTIKRDAPLTELVRQNVPEGWAADIRSLPDVGPSESRKHIKYFLQKEMNLPVPTKEDQEIEIQGDFEQGELRVRLLPQSRHGLAPDEKIAIYKGVGYFPKDAATLREAVHRKYKQLSNLEGTKLIALNMSAPTARREDLDEALFGVGVTQFDQRGRIEDTYFRRSGLFASGDGEPTISGVLAFPNTSITHSEDPVLWVHPRFSRDFPASISQLESRTMPDSMNIETKVVKASVKNIHENLGFIY